MIILVGIKHTLLLEEQLKKLIHDRHPDAIAVELDVFRYRWLTNQSTKEEITTYFSDVPNIYKMISSFKRKSQKRSGVDREWASGIILRIAKEIKAEVIPIDVDQLNLYREIERNMSLAEKIRVFFSLFSESFIPKKTMGEKEKDEEVFSEKFPTLKKYIIDFRDDHISKEIQRHSKNYKNLMVVLGNAHLKGIYKNIKTLKPEIIDMDMLKKII